MIEFKLNVENLPYLHITGATQMQDNVIQFEPINSIDSRGTSSLEFTINQQPLCALVVTGVAVQTALCTVT